MPLNFFLILEFKKKIGDFFNNKKGIFDRILFFEKYSDLKNEEKHYMKAWKR